jgi:hypothetical protein
MLLKIAIHPFAGRMPIAVNVAVARTIRMMVVSAGGQGIEVQTIPQPRES